MIELKDETKDFCLVLRGGIDVYLTASEARGVVNQANDEKLQKLIHLRDDRFIAPTAIVGIFTREDIEVRNRKKRGEWKCDYGLWHAKNAVCLCRNDTLPAPARAEFETAIAEQQTPYEPEEPSTPNDEPEEPQRHVFV